MRRTLVVAMLACLVWSGTVWSAEATAPTADSSAKAEVADEDSEVSAQDREQFNAYQRYQAHLKEQLRTSADPRDWALAAQIFVFPETGDSNDDRDTLMRNAASAAPNDVLVQWWAGNWREHAGNSCSRALPRPEIVAALQAIESDNGAAWLLGLDAALQAKDEAAVDRVLIQIAASKRFDTHFVDTIAAWSKAYETFGMPDWPERTSQDGASPTSASAQRLTLAVAHAVASAPGYYPLTQTCKVTAATTGKQFYRASLCEEAGRQMARVSTTLLDAKIGLALVRLSGREQPQDIEQNHELDWLKSALTAHAATLDFDSYFDDLLHTGNELEAYRRALQRAQLDAHAPAWWQPSLQAPADSADD